MAITKDFNSHAHVERDLFLHSNLKRKWHFNSHAHVERDTTTIHNEYIASNFNSHAHVERDVQTLAEQVTADISTHTLTWSVTSTTITTPAI